MRAHRLGIVAAIVALAVDQASKYWLLNVYDLGARQPVRLSPVLDLVLAWNRGVSYSLLTANDDAGRYALIAGTTLAILLLAVWLYRTRALTTGLAAGLLIGGALGNLVDRFTYGAVMDFVFFHIGAFRWYIFNGADCAITFGVALLLFEWLFLPPSASRR